MAQHSIEDFNGIVVSRKPYREKDLLVKILTDRFGFKTFFVRGAKGPKFKLRSALLTFSHGVYVGDVRDDGLSFINAAKDVIQYQSLTTNIELNAYATYLFGLLEAAFSENEPLGRWFLKMQRILELMDEGYDAEILTNIMEIQLLEPFGVKPDWESCVICQRTDLPFDFSEEYGGLLCQNHWHKDPHRLHLNQRTIYYLRLFSVLDLNRLNSIQVKPETKKELRKTIDQIYNDLVGVHLKSKKFIDEMQQWNSGFSNDIVN